MNANHIPPGYFSVETLSLSKGKQLLLVTQQALSQGPSLHPSAPTAHRGGSLGPILSYREIEAEPKARAQQQEEEKNF